MKSDALRRVLVTGSPGAGKSTLVQELLSMGSMGMVADLDWFGSHLPTESDETKWIVKAHAVEVLFQAPCDLWCFGTCANLYTGVRYTEKVPHYGTKVKTAKPVAYSLPWTHRVLLVWDPTEDEYLRRFSSSRQNDYGKSEPTRSRVLQHARQLFERKAPRGFIKLDVTGMTIIEALNSLFDDVVLTDRVPEEAVIDGETDYSSKEEQSTQESRAQILGEGGV